MTRIMLIFLDGGNSYEQTETVLTVRQAFQSYKKYNPQKMEKLILWLFLIFPWLYRKLRYEIFKL